ncbi:MAG TPA: hypothetical protein VEW93_00235 [Acidimicrobiales bacterium]|nr:hypothetical protein [Acidimicrobiales bacterium]
MTAQFKPGDRVIVPWGLDGEVLGTVVEVWGDPPAHVRVQLDAEGDADEPVILLLAPSAVAAA